MPRTVTSGSLTADDSFTPPARFAAGSIFNVSVSGTFTATVTLQKSYDGGDTWLDQNPDGSWTAPTELVCDNAEDCLWRIGVKAGDYTSGTANVRLSQ